VLAQLTYCPSHRAQKVLAFLNGVGKALAREVYQYTRKLALQEISHARH
jgi:hypothetical protein